MIRRALLLFLLGACASTSPSTQPQPQTSAQTSPSPSPSPSPRESPPPPGAGKDWSFPPVARTALPNGANVLAIEASALPIVEIRAVIRAGSGFAAPGVAEATAELVRDGGTGALSSARMLERIEALGTSLAIDVGFDATTFALSVPSDRAEAAVRLLAEVLSDPRFEDGEWKRLRARKIDQAEDAARAGGAFVATRVALRELFAGPYANGLATGSDFGKIGLPSIREFYKQFYGARSVTLVLAGAGLDPARKAAVATFGRLRSTERPKLPASTALAPKPLHLVVCDRPKSVQSDVFVFALAPERRSREWPALRVANQALGGGVASRLFSEVREKRGLAYAVRSQIVELADGPELFAVYAGTQTPKTADTVRVLLGEVTRLDRGVGADEATAAARFLHDVFAVRVDGVRALATLAAEAETLGLGDRYWDAYRAALSRVRVDDASAAAKTLAALDHAMVVVSGDASALEAPLSAIGDVVVVRPEDDFRVVRSVPRAR